MRPLFLRPEAGWPPWPPFNGAQSEGAAALDGDEPPNALRWPARKGSPAHLAGAPASAARPTFAGCSTRVG